MTRNKKILIGVGVVVILGALAFANFKFKRQDGLAVNVETVRACLWFSAPSVADAAGSWSYAARRKSAH